MQLRLFAPASKVADQTSAAGDQKGDEFAVILWSVVFVFWAVACVHNWWHGNGDWNLPEVPSGIMALLAALPVSKAVTFLRR